jgi:hypothetical protein
LLAIVPRANKYDITLGVDAYFLYIWVGMGGINHGGEGDLP